jgi:polyphosphate kinase
MPRPPLTTALGLVLALAPLPAPLAAHPHIFVDASHELVFDETGRLVALRSRWEYDPLFTLLMVEDGGYDADGDGDISTAELAAMQEWDANWPADYGGDVELEQGGALLALGPPTDWAADWRDGKAISMHTRPLAEPVEIGAGLVLRAFDPVFYVGYTIAAPPVFTGRSDCRAELVSPDTSKISRELAEEIANLPPEADPQAEGLGEIGRLYAEELRITCGD